jgi:hypothetical protein
MGFEPHAIAHLRLAAANASRALDTEEIEVDPADYGRYAVRFTPPPEDIAIEFPNVEVSDRESCSACLSTVAVFLKRYYGELAEMLGPERKLYIAIGKGEHEPRGVTVCVGNCTEKFKDQGVYVQGCPPVASDIYVRVHDFLSERPGGKR